ncbi:MAG: tyrosine-protein phosphatase, partial [Verrucomicrobiota bacterium]
HDGWRWLLLWPAISFGGVAIGYVHLGPAVFGKNKYGVISPIRQLLLAPYLIYLHLVWHSARLLKREPAWNQVTDRIYIGRRLLSHELPKDIEHVIDLTCEFAETTALRSRTYHSFQILDAAAPSTEKLVDWINFTADLEGIIYIHCAEGHGRTGLFAALLLVRLGRFSKTADALAYIKTQRPLVGLNRQQSLSLEEAAKQI